MTTQDLQGIAKLHQAHTYTNAARQLSRMAVREFALSLSWPASELMQNRHDGRHWSYAANEKAAYRHEGYLMALSAINASGFDSHDGARYRISMTFHAPDNRRRDVSNLHAAMKAALDGIANAMGVDDSNFVEHTQRKGCAIERGRVDVHVEEI